ncbi:MAG: hypothetical protein ACLGI6_02355 [Gammaproteobacteria bacterium]
MITNQPIRRSLLIAAIYLLSALVLNELRQHQLVSAETVMRLMGILIGSAVLVSANALPKKLVPLERLSCAPAREQGFRRFTAWALVAGSLGFMLAYALAPIAIASTLAICLLAPAVLVVLGIGARCVRMNRTARRDGV